MKSSNKKRKHKELEDKIENMSNTLEAMKEFFMKGAFQTSQGQNKPKAKQGSGDREDSGKAIEIANNNSNSDTTIYKKVQDRIETSDIDDPEIILHMPLNNTDRNEDIDRDQCNKRDSSSLEERVNTSNELMDVDLDIHDKFIADCAEEAKRLRKDREDEVQSARERADDTIRQAEAGKAQMFATPGKTLAFEKQVNHDNQSSARWNFELSCQRASTAMDDNYLMIGGNSIDQTLQEKIIKGNYVDLARLLPKDRQNYDDNKLELVFKVRHTFFVPAVDHDSQNSAINNLHRWEQTFRVYSNIYLKGNPGRASELIQYNHTINTAASSYTWEYVYAYNREFRSHMAKFPNRNWGLILQQAWTMILKDRIRHDYARNGRSSFHKQKRKYVKGLIKESVLQVWLAVMNTNA